MKVHPLKPAPINSVSVVIPVYNSESTLGPLCERVIEVLTRRLARFEIILVNDGSRDGSHVVALRLAEEYPKVVKYLRLAANFGEHNAVMCGLHHVECDAAVIIDDDFQNPPHEIVRLVAKLNEGYDVVYGQYERKYHNMFRNVGSAFNNWVATRALGKPHDLYLSSFKALNGFLIQAILEYRGPFPYIDGLVLRTTRSIGTCLCEHAEREVGVSNYTFRKLVSLWLAMVTSHSVLPLRLAALTGAIVALIGMALTVLFIIAWATGGVFLHQDIPPGWASTISLLTSLAGVQLLVLGLIGEYLGRVFMTQNGKPQYVIRERCGAFADMTEKPARGNSPRDERTADELR